MIKIHHFPGKISRGLQGDIFSSYYQPSFYTICTFGNAKILVTKCRHGLAPIRDFLLRDQKSQSCTITNRDVYRIRHDTSLCDVACHCLVSTRRKSALSWLCGMNGGAGGCYKLVPQRPRWDQAKFANSEST